MMQVEATAVELDERAERLRMIEESADGALKGGRERARHLRFTLPSFDRGQVEEFANLGWLALRVGEQDGGLGLGLAEICVIAKHMGRQLSPEPVLAAASIAPLLPPEERDAVLSGRKIVLPAFAAFGSNPGDGVALEPVIMGAGADAFVVADGRGARLVQRSELPDLAVQNTHDGGHLVHLQLAVGAGQDLGHDLDRAREEFTLALSAYLLGVSEAAFDITLRYLKDRKQFDRPIGSFQSLQHKMVDLYLELSLLQAAVGAACSAFDDGESMETCTRMVSLAKARASLASSTITRAAIQLHGGIGYTDEADIGLYLRKVMTLSGLMGSERFHRDRAFALSGIVS
jgi:alkylation response protein AidB-like acyl-CoA dehydrogenase